MRRILLILVLASYAAAQSAVSGYVNMNLTSPAAPGTALTPTILNNGSVGAIGGWAISGTTANMTVGTHNPNCTLSQPIAVGTTTYGTGMPSQSFAMNMAAANTIATATVSGAGRVSVFSFCWTAPSGSPTNVQDILATELSTRGFELWIQWVPTNSLRLESAKDSFATSAGISLVPGNTYQVVLLDDYINGLMKLAVFNTLPPYAQVGTTQQMNQFIDAGHVSRFFIGNGEFGTSASSQKIENLLLDNTSNGSSFPTLGVGTTLGAPLSQGIISPTRAIDWSGAGVVGGIPSASWTQSGATMATSSTAAQINTRLASCGNNQFVLLAAGTFNLSDAIVFTNKTNCALRGAGADQTFLVFSGVATTCGGGAPVGICMRATDGNFSGGPTNTANWTAGYNDGNTNISLSSVPNLSVGKFIILDQLDDTQSGCDAGGVLVSDITTTCTVGSPTAPGVNGPYSGQGNGGGARSHRAQQQIVQVAQCDGNSTAGHACVSGANITISPGLYMPNWSAADTPQAWWATSPSQFVGVENLSIDNTNNGQNANACLGGIGIGIYNSPNSWVSGVRDVLSVRAHVQIILSPHVTVRGNYFYGTQNRTSCSYGVEIFSSSDSLIENNIFQAVASPYMSNGPDAGVVGDYNFSTLNLYTASSLFTANAHGDHDAGNGLTLWEGNVGNVVNADVIHGTGNFGTYFRNRYSGLSTCWQSSTNMSSTATVIATGTFASCNNNLSPFVLNSFHRFYNLLGNVVGTTGTNTGYTSGTWPNFDLGAGNSGFTPPVPNDPNVAATVMLWGNVDASHGFGSSQFNSSEVPSGLVSTFQQFFSNPVPTSNALPASFLYSTKPAWWPVLKAWPPIGPDVAGGNITGVGGHAFTIPAQDCAVLMGIPADGTGPVRTFNAACSTAAAAPDDTLAGPNPGWSTCVLPSCDPGGVNPPAATAQTINNASPSLDGASMQFSLTSPAGGNSNALWVYKYAPNDAANLFATDFWVYPAANCSVVQQFEYDTWMSSVTDNIEYMFGMQYNRTSGKWEIWNQLSPQWIPTAATSPLICASWNHIQQTFHRVIGDTNKCSGKPCMYFDTLTVNGVRNDLYLAKPAGTKPATWGSNVGIQWQLNIPGASTTSTENLDSVLFSATTGTPTQTIYRPTVVTDSGTAPTSNAALAYDGDPATFASGVSTNTTAYTVVYRGFPALVGPLANAVIYVVSDAYSAGAGLGGTQAEYSLDSGATWNQIWVGPSYGSQNTPKTDRISLPIGQDFTQVQVRFGQVSSCSPPGCTITGQEYEVWIQTTESKSQIQGTIQGTVQ